MAFLSPGEKVYLKFKTSILYPEILKYIILSLALIIISVVFFIGTLDIGILTSQDTGLIAILFSILLVVAGEIKREEIGVYYITNYRVISKRGILNTKTYSVSYTNLVNIVVSQTLKEKLFKLGNMDLISARKKEMSIFGIKNAAKIESLIYGFLEIHVKGIQNKKRRRRLTRQGNI